MDYRNPTYNSVGTIDCEINHPKLGWVPFTADPNDSEKTGRDLHKQILAAGNVAEYVEPPALEPTGAEVDAERDRRIDAGFVFEGHTYQSDRNSRENIAGAKSAAMDAIALGAQSGELSWQQRLDPTAPDTFVWIDADNNLVPMDAYTVVQLGYAALTHKQRMIFAAKALKEADPKPKDYQTNENYWISAYGSKNENIGLNNDI